jgi:hypothetical protein
MHGSAGGSMPKRARQLTKVRQLNSYAGQRVGRIVRVEHDGVAWVTFPGCPDSVAVAARSTLDAPASHTARPDALVGAAVLLVFENADPNLPIICGILNDRVQPKPAVIAVTLEGSAKDVVLDGRQIVLSAQQQILLRCGKSSILLRRDGKVEIRGTELLSRASGANKIKGGTIDLN